MKSSNFFRVLLAVLVLAGGLLIWRHFAGPGPSAEWSEFRGPTQDGHSTATGLPTEWSTEKNVVWKTVLPGRAWSSPIVAGDRIYLTNAINAKNDDDLHANVSLHLLALDATGGKVLWDKEVFFIEEPYSSGFNDKNSHASPTPVHEQGRIYAHFGNFGTACMDEQGNIVWKTKEPAFKTELGNGGCPIVVDDLLVFNCDGVEEPFVVALDKATGRERWRTLRNRKAKNLYALSTPLLINVNGGRQIITVGTRTVQALAPKDGHEIWHMYHGNYCAVPRPVYGQGIVFISTGFDHASAYAIKPDGKGNLTEKNLLWETNKNVPLTPSMLVVGEDLYMVSDNGIVTCLDTKTGKVWWEERVGKSTSASLFFAAGRIYMQDEFGKGYVLKPGHKLELLATNDLADKSLASYAVHGRHLLIRTRHALWCIGEKK